MNILILPPLKLRIPSLLLLLIRRNVAVIISFCRSASSSIAGVAVPAATA